MSGIQTKIGEQDFTQQGNRFFIGKRLVGWMAHNDDGALIFISPRKRIEHYFRKFSGWAISSDLLAFLKTKEVKEIWLKVDGTEIISAQLNDYISHGRKYHQQPYESQIILSETLFKKIVDE